MGPWRYGSDHNPRGEDTIWRSPDTGAEQQQHHVLLSEELMQQDLQRLWQLTGTRVPGGRCSAHTALGGSPGHGQSAGPRHMHCCRAVRMSCAAHSCHVVLLRADARLAALKLSRDHDLVAYSVASASHDHQPHSCIVKRLSTGRRGVSGVQAARCARPGPLAVTQPQS